MVTVIDTLANRPRPRHPEKAHRPDQDVARKPDWIRVRAPTSPGYLETRDIVRTNKLVTVCEEAGCPNIGECWDKKHASFLIMGEICTRACAFCNVTTGLPNALDADEPQNVASAVRQMGLNHVVVTSVDRDDLADGGARHFAEVIRAIRAESPETTIEVLTPDFLRKDGALEIVVEAKPDVFNHNLETVPSHYLTVRPGARYFHSIRLLQRVKELDPTMFTKSGIMVGLGEERAVLAQEVGRQHLDGGAAADGRSAHRRCRLLDHRPVSPADAQTPSGQKIRHPGGVQILRDGRLYERLPARLSQPADALLAPCGRGFRPAAGGARGATGENRRPVGRHAEIRNRPQRRPYAAANVRSGRRY